MGRWGNRRSWGQEFKVVQAPIKVKIHGKTSIIGQPAGFNKGQDVQNSQDIEDKNELRKRNIEEISNDVQVLDIDDSDNEQQAQEEEVIEPPTKRSKIGNDDNSESSKQQTNDSTLDCTDPEHETTNDASSTTKTPTKRPKAAVKAATVIKKTTIESNKKVDRKQENMIQEKTKVNKISFFGGTNQKQDQQEDDDQEGNEEMQDEQNIEAAAEGNQDIEDAQQDEIQEIDGDDEPKEKATDDIMVIDEEEVNITEKETTGFQKLASLKSNLSHVRTEKPKQKAPSRSSKIVVKAPNKQNSMKSFIKSGKPKTNDQPDQNQSNSFNKMMDTTKAQGSINSVYLPGVANERPPELLKLAKSGANKNSEEAPQTDGEELEQASTQKTTHSEISKEELEENLKKPYKDQSKLKKMDNYGFCPIKDAPYYKGQPMPFSFAVNAMDTVIKQSGPGSQSVIIETMSNVFRCAIVNNPSEMPDLFYFFIVKLAPDHEALETGIGHEMSVKAIAKACGKLPKEIRELFKKEGDLGLVCQLYKNQQVSLSGFFKSKNPTQKKEISFQRVFSEMRRIARTSGEGSTAAKENIMTGVLREASNDECKYIVRFLQKTLKTGAAYALVVCSLARAIVNTPPNKPNILNVRKKVGEAKFLELCKKAEESINQAFCEYPDYGEVVQSLLRVGDEHHRLAETCYIRVGFPVKPMLAKPEKGINEVLKRFAGMEFTCEYKYDGFRGQIHYDKELQTEYADGDSKDCLIYSRNLENLSRAYPDVIENLKALIGPNVRNFILDSELVPYDDIQNKILPFQILTNRSRKNVTKEDLKNKVAIYAFDLLYLNDQPLLKTSLKERRKLLLENFICKDGQFHFAESSDLNNFEDLAALLTRSVKDGCEGLMVKTLEKDSSYEVNKRSLNWVKLKKDYLDDLGDSMDLVVLGADYGTGKRTGWFSSILLGCWNAEYEKFETICKCGSGLTDEAYIEWKAKLMKIKVEKPDERIQMGNRKGQELERITCDVWFEPMYVWEIRTADLSLSPNHTAGIGSADEHSPEKGVALRFNRFMRERPDKRPEDATTTEQVVEMYQNQVTVMTANAQQHPEDQKIDEDEFDL